MGVDEDLYDEFTEEDIHRGLILFNVVYCFLVFCSFVLAGLMIYAGYVSVSVYWTVPMFALVWFLLQTFKRYFRNLANTIIVETDIEEKFEEQDREHKAVDLVERTHSSMLKQILIVLFTSIAVALFWYFAGFGIALFVGPSF